VLGGFRTGRPTAFKMLKSSILLSLFILLFLFI
jgi:hypothetical protein